jgi:hypothetical protein
MRLKITLERSIRQQADILSPAVRSAINPLHGADRYRLSRRKQLIEEYFETAPWDDDWNPRYNIAPTPARPGDPPESGPSQTPGRERYGLP